MCVCVFMHQFIYTQLSQDLVKPWQPCCFLFQELFKLFKADESIFGLINLLQRRSSWTTVMTATSTATCDVLSLIHCPLNPKRNSFMNSSIVFPSGRTIERDPSVVRMEESSLREILPSPLMSKTWNTWDKALSIKSVWASRHPAMNSE